MASSSYPSVASSAVRTWRTSFLSLRDEALASPPPAALLDILRSVVLSHPTGVLAAAAADLSPHEVLSDVVFLAQLGSDVCACENVDDSMLQLCILIHHVSSKFHEEVNSLSWMIMLDFLAKIVDCVCGKAERKRYNSSSSSGMNCMIEVVGIIRQVTKGYGKNLSTSESTILVNLLLRIVSCSYVAVFSHPCTVWLNTISGIRNSKCSSLWELHLVAFSMIGDALSRNNSPLSVDTWQSAFEVLREVMDLLVSKNLLSEGYKMSRCYVALLDCLHLVLSSPKISISEHVAGLLIALQKFLTYGLNSRTLPLPEKEEHTSSRPKSGSAVSETVQHSRYIPPHLRKKGVVSSHISTTTTSEYESFKHEFTSSDSEHSDSDRTTKNDAFRSSKARIAAIICIQDICRADPKSLTSMWTILLPTNDILQPWKNQGSLMTCLLFDPVFKTRLTSLSAFITLLESHSSVFLQVAEYKESSKCESFTTLSSSLGQILMQIHRGVLHLIQHETHGGLFAPLFKALSTLISATPYSRMPEELLPMVVTSIRRRIVEGPTIKADQSSFMGTAFCCLAAAMSTSPPSKHMSKILEEEASTGLISAADKSNTLSFIFQFSQKEVHPAVRFEALQTIKALLHSYPIVATICWEHLFTSVHEALQNSLCKTTGLEVTENLCIDLGNSLGSANERCTTATIKVMDECLRATSGFQGTDNLLECRLLDIQYLSESTRSKRVSSAPSYELNMTGFSNGSLSGHTSGVVQWTVAIDKHLPQSLSHSSPMIRAAAVTCFAGLTSSVFFALGSDKQQFVICSIVQTAVNDKVSSVRAAACRAIGVVSCFSQIFNSAEVLEDIIHAIERNIHDSQISVRIPSSWALANICDSLRHRAADLHSCDSPGQVADPRFISFLFDSALHLTKDGDKIKANAVRALGNLSRFIDCSHNYAVDNECTTAAIELQRSQSWEIHHCSETSDPGNPSRVINSSCMQFPLWPERMVRAFVSCVTTGNVKVQWNVCHALGNLFLNESLELKVAPWASSVYSILLLLLRDSTNFKIRIHAAVALAMPTSRVDYGNSFADIVQGLEHLLESLASERVSDPSNFKYRDAFEKQLVLTMLHVLGLASSMDDQSIRDFLAKKATFLEQWLSRVCSSLPQTSDQPESGPSSASKLNTESSHVLRKQMVLKAMKSLSELYKSTNNIIIARRFEKLAES